MDDEVIHAGVKWTLGNIVRVDNQSSRKHSWLAGTLVTKADLILDSTTAGQLVAVGDGDYYGRFEEKGIPSL